MFYAEGLQGLDYGVEGSGEQREGVTKLENCGGVCYILDRVGVSGVRSEVNYLGGKEV